VYTIFVIICIQYWWLLIHITNIIILYYRNQARNNQDILKFYSMEQDITHYSRGKLHIGQITVRGSARSTK
jgi:hypothetical protein